MSSVAGHCLQNHLRINAFLASTRKEWSPAAVVPGRRRKRSKTVQLGAFTQSPHGRQETRKSAYRDPRSVKFLCQVAPRREVPYARGPEPRPGCEKLRGCFCMACRQSIPPSWRALQGCLAHCLERGLAQVLNMGRAKV